jgi:hypothetical protein
VTTQRVASTGTQRRIKHLRADGWWSYANIAAATGLDTETVRRVQYRKLVNRSTAIAVYGVYLTYPVQWHPFAGWDDDTLDRPVTVAQQSTHGVRAGYRPAVHVVEDLDDIAEQMGFVRQETMTGWEPRARRHVAARLGMSARSFDRAVYRGRARLGERSAA